MKKRITKLKLPETAGPTPEQFALVIGWHPESVRRAIRKSRIRALVFGREYRIPEDEVQRILAKGLPA